MQARLTTKPVQEVVAAIQALDLESVKSRLTDADIGEGWTREHADGIEIAYKHYLTMLVKYPEDADDILLSEDVDEFWHTHILQTRKYLEDCQHVFGNFLHHEPHVGEVTTADIEKRTVQAEKTRRLYEQEFGGTRESQMAWSGQVVQIRNAAYSTAAIRTAGAAYSTASIRSQGAAYSTAAIKTATAAYSTANIGVQGAAYSTAAVRAEKAAYSTAAIKAAKAAYSTAAIGLQGAAYSTAAVRPEKAAYSTASIQVEDPDSSTAAVSAKNAAYSTAAIQA